MAEADLTHAIEALEMKLAHERELRQLRDDFDAKALELQALEYERRLETLNHEHARTSTALAMSVPREVFDAFKSENSKWQVTVTEALAEARGAAARQTAIFTGLMLILGIVFKFWP